MIFSRSLRWRIQLWHGLLLVAVLAGFGLTTWRLQQSNEMHRVDQELALRAKSLMSWMRESGPPGDSPPPPRKFDLTPERAALFNADESHVFYFVIWRRDGNEAAHSDQAPAGLPMPPRSTGDPMIPISRTREDRRESWLFTPPGECILVGRSISPEIASMRQFGFGLAALSAAVLAAGLVGGAFLARRAIRPIDAISDAAGKIAAGDLSRRIDTDDNHSELGRLIAVLNSTFARLESVFAQQARFTADAAHELRTPVSVIVAQAQLALSRPRASEDYRQSLETCLRAAQRMQSLINSLLDLSALDAKAHPPAADPQDLSRIAGDCLQMIAPLAAEKNIRIETTLQSAPARGDGAQLAQVVTNLLSNALRFTPAQGAIHLRTRIQGGQATLQVKDTGPGIAPDQLPLLFQRFHRADPSRSRQNGGAGLGLAICKAIAEAHRGTLHAANNPDGGCTFTFSLPI